MAFGFCTQNCRRRCRQTQSNQCICFFFLLSSTKTLSQKHKKNLAYNFENNYAFFAHLTNQCNSDAKNGNSQKENQRPNKAETQIFSGVVDFVN